MYSAGLITWYVVMVYVPTILTTYGFQLSNSVILTGCMMVIGGAGSVVIGPLADKHGRKPIWSLYVIITIISLFLLTSTDSIPMLLFIGSFVAFFGTGIMPVCKVYIAEQYPTELRGVGTGFGEAVSRVVGGVLATYYLAFFLSVGGVKGVFTFMAVAFAIAIIALWIWGQETARRSVEDTSAAPQKVTHAPRHLPLGAGTPTKGRFFHVRYAVFHHHHTGRSRVARGELTSAALVRHALEAVRLHDGTLNAMLHVSASALEEAERCDAEAAQGSFRGPLHGIPPL